MKIKYMVVYILLLSGICVCGTVCILQVGNAKTPYAYGADPVSVNRLIQDTKKQWNTICGQKGEKIPARYDMCYAVIGADGELLVYTDDGISTDIAQATRHGDVIREISVDDRTVGWILISNESETREKKMRGITAAFFAALCMIQILVLVLYSLYLYRNVIKPFRKMERFASGIAAGNLDIRLERDKHNMFGAFTESFDIMREELLLAREREAQAKQSRKELVAELSHDIKTPVASIKALSEVMLLTAEKESERTSLEAIIAKADQIDLLVSNLFHATLEELEQLSVTLDDIESTSIAKCISESDYKNKISGVRIPDCIVRGDFLRMEQIVGNILTNSYKYADTDITVESRIENGVLLISFRDYGDGVLPEELEKVTQKFGRGQNSTDVKGSGLGLYLSAYLCEKMNGSLVCENANPGFSVTVSFPLA